MIMGMAESAKYRGKYTNSSEDEQCLNRESVTKLGNACLVFFETPIAILECGATHPSFSLLSHWRGCSLLTEYCFKSTILYR